MRSDRRQRRRTCPCESRDDALMVDQETLNFLARIYDSRVNKETFFDFCVPRKG